MEFSRAGFPLSRSKVCALAFQYAEVNELKGFSRNSHKAGKKWMCFFLKRHPQIHIKKVHNLSINRAMCANPTMINKFFDQYESLLRELKIDSPKQIWNCDESSCPDVPKEREVVGETGIPASQIVAKEQGENTTILTFVNADGDVVPPIVIHKGSCVADSWTMDVPVGVMVRASKKGWINRNIFIEYATRWVHWMKSHKYLDRPHILLLDSHKSHVYNI